MFECFQQAQHTERHIRCNVTYTKERRRDWDYIVASSVGYSWPYYAVLLGEGKVFTSIKSRVGIRRIYFPFDASVDLHGWQHL